METIFALASGAGRAGVAVIRVSGPDAFRIAEVMCGSVPKARGLRTLRSRSGEVLDEALVLRFEPGASFTGEGVVELQCHGSPAVVQAVLSELDGFEGARRAEGGEFTRRALLAGRLDLPQVEGLADLIDAETEAQRKQAMRLFSGEMSDLVAGWRDDLIRAAALLEATIDFADEDVPVDVTPEVTALAAKVLASVEDQRRGLRAAERVRSGFEVAILGAPNTGKSTLLNRLAGREAAITSEHAGTTRDVVEVVVDVSGVPVTFIDTAGLREAVDPVERIGINRALERGAQADVIVVLGDTQVDTDQIADQVVYRFIPKDDEGAFGEDGISGKTGVGVAALLERIGKLVSNAQSGAGLMNSDRHRRALESCVASLTEVQDLLGSGAETDIIADELRQSVRTVKGIIGGVHPDDVLDVVFSRFCIGK